MINAGQPMLEGTPREIMRADLLEIAFNCRCGQLAGYMDRAERRMEIAS
jgi:hypothetical protein